jgi:hypothetical protein
MKTKLLVIALALLALVGCDKAVDPGTIDLATPQPVALIRSAFMVAEIDSFTQENIHFEFYRNAAAGNTVIAISKNADSCVVVIVGDAGDVQAGYRPSLWNCIAGVYRRCRAAFNPDLEAAEYNRCVAGGMTVCVVGDWLLGWACESNK